MGHRSRTVWNQPVSTRQRRREGLLSRASRGLHTGCGASAGDWGGMNYYNEFDTKAAAWLQELINAGLIPNGDIDTRSIADVRATDLVEYRQCHFFAGIGGWPLALQLAGWPRDREVWSGSCPCQPFSVAGKGKGEADERHLWPVFRDLIDECRPAVVFGEQVASKAGRGWLSGVRAQVEELGYAVGVADLCAASVGAPHIRQRLFWVAYANNTRLQETGTRNKGEGRAQLMPCSSERVSRLANANGGNPCSQRQQRGGQQRQQPQDGGVGRLGDADCAGLNEQRRPIAVSTQQSPAQLRGNSWDSLDLLPCTDGKARRVEPGTFPLADGVPGRVGLLRGYGNAIVPELAAQFIQACEEALAL